MKDFVEGPVHIGIAVSHPDQLRGVYAVLASSAACAAALAAIEGNGTKAPVSAPSGNVAAPIAAEASDSAAEASPNATNEASRSSADGEIDAHGHPWSEDLHASTKGKTKDGLWRLKPGASRPDPLPGFPKEEAGNGGTGTSSPSAPEPSTEAAPTGDAGPATTDEDDEFAAFASAANDTPANKPARSWSDADLSKLCNQAAQALGGPDKIRELIAKYVPEGSTAHSRNILEEDREDFAQSVESAAGIEFAG